MPKHIPPEEREQGKALYKTGKSQKEIAILFNRPCSSIHQIVHSDTKKADDIYFKHTKEGVL